MGAVASLVVFGVGLVASLVALVTSLAVLASGWVELFGPEAVAGTSVVASLICAGAIAISVLVLSD
jgi:hypothetical protein